MKIAMVSYLLPRSDQKRGGIERVADQLAGGLTRRGHVLEVWTYEATDPLRHYKTRSLPGKSLFFTWLGRRLIVGFLGNVFSIAALCSRAEVVILHGDSLLVSLLFRKTLRIFHGSARREALSAQGWRRRIGQHLVFFQESIVARLYPFTVAVSANSQSDNPAIAEVIPNGVDRSVFHPHGEDKTPDPSLIFVGRMDGRKRGQWFLEQTVELRKAFPRLQVFFVGDQGPRLPGVTYLPSVSDRALADLYRRAWVCVSASSYEGFGLPVLEAMACGTAILAIDNPGARELLAGGQYGILSDDTQFLDHLGSLLSDASGRRRWGERGLHRALQYDLEKTLDRYEQRLNSIISAPRWSWGLRKASSETL